MFALDRDLLVLDPSVFRDAAWAGQRVISATGSIAGTVLTLSAGDLEAAGVTAGHVVLAGGAGGSAPEALEVVERTGPLGAVVSRPRDSLEGPAIPPSALVNGAVVVVSFRPQIALVHGRVLRMLGIDPDDAGAGPPRESDITNPRALALLEALGALHAVWSAASALSGEGSPAWARAESFRRRFAEERGAALARVDLDGDGVADAVRRAGGGPIVRGW